MKKGLLSSWQTRSPTTTMGTSVFLGYQTHFPETTKAAGEFSG